MKKLLFVSAIILAASTSSFAQDEKASDKPLTFSVGIEGALPFGDFGDSYTFGIGGSVQGDYKLSSDLAVTLNAGYVSYSAKSISVPTGIDASGNLIYTKEKGKALGLIPVLAGIRYWFSPAIYGSGQLGLSFGSGSGSGSNFTYAPGVGFKFSQIDILVKYTGLSVKTVDVSSAGVISNATTSFGSIGIRAAYNF